MSCPHMAVGNLQRQVQAAGDMKTSQWEVLLGGRGEAQSELRALWSLLRANFTQNKHQVLLQLLRDTYNW